MTIFPFKNCFIPQLPFPEPHAYWTGYFTSRPSLKFHERQSNALLIAAKQAVALAGGKDGAAGVEVETCL